MKPMIAGLTISIDIGDKEYGKGQSCFMNLQGKYPEPGQPLDELMDVVDDGLEMYFAAWKTLLAGRFATGQITKDQFNNLATVARRVKKIQEFLKAPSNGESETPAS
jgi:hypothetical protein